MTEQDWVRVLEVIYHEDIYWSKDADIDENHPVVSAINMEPEDVKDALAYLNQVELIGSIHVGIKAEISRSGKEGIVGIPENARKTGTHIGLTSKGFEVAHERQLRNSQRRTNIGIGMLTIILAIGSIMQGYSAYISLGRPIDQVPVIISTGLVLLIGAFVFLYMTGDLRLVLRKIGIS
jgi:hypothetical protein